MAAMATAIPTVVGPARLRFTTRADGDFHADAWRPRSSRRRQRAVVDLPWTWLDQVHGAEVVTRPRAGRARRRTRPTPRSPTAPARCSPCGSATARPSRWSAPTGVIGVAHAGWRGLRGRRGRRPPSRPCAGSVRRDVGGRTSGRASGPSATSSAPTTSTTAGSRFGADGAWPRRPPGAPALDVAAARGREPGRGRRATSTSIGPLHGLRRPATGRTGPAATSGARPWSCGWRSSRDGRSTSAWCGDRLVALRRRIAARRRRPDGHRRRRHQGLRPRGGRGGRRRRARRHRRELRPGAAGQGWPALGDGPAPAWHFIGRLQRTRSARWPASSTCGRASTGRRWSSRDRQAAPPAPRCWCR